MSYLSRHQNFCMLDEKISPRNKTLIQNDMAKENVYLIFYFLSKKIIFKNILTQNLKK